MKLDKYLNLAALCFKYRKLICAALEKNPGQIVCITAKSGKTIRVQDAAKWNRAMELTYSVYRREQPEVYRSMKRLFENDIPAETLSGLMGVSRRVFYEKRKNFLLEMVMRGLEMGVLVK